MWLFFHAGVSKMGPQETCLIYDLVLVIFIYAIFLSFQLSVHWYCGEMVENAYMFNVSLKMLLCGSPVKTTMRPNSFPTTVDRTMYVKNTQIYWLWHQILYGWSYITQIHMRKVLTYKSPYKSVESIVSLTRWHHRFGMWCNQNLNFKHSI